MDFQKIDYEITKDILDKYNYPNKKVGVIVHIQDKNGKILLQQRGKKSRDEIGLYEAVGGSVDKADKDYKSAIIREMKEEMGEEAKIDLLGSIGIFHCQKADINWVFVVFMGTYINGKINIMEPDKCLRYKFFDYEEAIKSNKVSDSCKYLIRIAKDIS